MPALHNARHEAYAQQLAEGVPQIKAYVAAGFPYHRGNASKLAKHKNVRARVEELIDGKVKARERAIAIVARKETLSRQWVIDKLVLNAEIALGERPWNPRASEPEYRYDGAVAARSLELLGREVGLFVERKQIDVVADVRKLSDAELLQQIRETAGELLELTAEDAPEEVEEAICEEIIPQPALDAQSHSTK